MSEVAASQLPVSGPWIISRREDLLWFQGSALAGVALLLFFCLQPPLRNGSYSIWNPVVMVLRLWGILFDGTHVWGTYARSYLAADESSRAALPGNWSWAVIAVGPLIAVVDHALLKPEVSLLSNAGWLFRSFLVFA